MTKIRTHYDNLGVAREAPPEVIRAAYRALALKFHPDKNPGNTEASKLMAAINISFDVLIDPAKRLAHDRWIADQERLASESDTYVNLPKQTTQSTKLPSPSEPNNISKITSHISRYWFWYGLATVLLWFLSDNDLKLSLPGPKPYRSTAPVEPPPPPQPVYVRPSTAPNGQPWPKLAAYVNQYPRLKANGLSSITIDNSQNDSDVFVKLISLSEQEAFPVRTFFIPANGTFKLRKVTAGNYDIRYRDLNNGALSRSEAFVLEETPIEGGTRYSNMTMTLYKIQNGNMQTYSLAESEF